MTAKYAALTDRDLKLPEILELTPRQIHDIYGAPRDQDGKVKAPLATNRYDALFELIKAGTIKATPEQIAKLEAMRNDSRRATSAD